jgi:accessory colonization factor AcfC
MPRSLSVAITLVAAITTSSAALAAQPLRVYGPGGPLPAMKDAAAAFERSHGVAVRSPLVLPRSGLTTQL